MLLTLTATASPALPDATDLGFLLFKHPGRAQRFPSSVGVAHVFWPEATAARSTVALLVEVDPIGLVRGRGGRGSAESSALSQYVNDRPYAASSMLTVALGRVFGTAMTGRCDARPELVGRALDLEISLPALPARGGADLTQRLFAPLGWSVTAAPLPLDPELPDWGDSPYQDVRLAGRLTVATALTQLSVLIPVLDDGKHHWIGDDDVDKLLRSGGDWLPGHPERDLITRRYLGHHRTLVQDASTRFAALDDRPDDQADATPDATPARPLQRLRREAVLAALRAEQASSVVDLGCGEGALLRDLLADSTFSSVIGVDVSHRALAAAGRRLQLDRMPDRQRDRLQLLQSSATYRDDRLTGQDAVVLMEVIEHLDADRLPALSRSVFGAARPRTVLVTTPNAEHNVRYPHLAAGTMRHRDHRFEWTRAEFRSWADDVAAAHGYDVQFSPIGDDDPQVGPPTQMAVFRRSA
ncbi:3' terminal RNA ribose 2'-O-methyltransferase Hen1 [Nakamurella leprariae]|uniref:Small RNA 2'-O-methyltransferase n=1 Tax=Nakamurella leprariae TaxID=2803911 RepID=A0A939BW02_9ACTN|nr:3' terminal RNA ribose 2'-O-methyltransferase Hen1 [Nakamurella leprariae]MBM9467048.1 3' terminal RNA ribose 2'-O-methyltransferase Hen1 [Nakamurella leprariae]